MAKVSLNKLLIKKNTLPIMIKIGDTDVEITQYLPVSEKAILIEKILNDAFDDRGIISPVRQKVSTTLNIIMAYTNLNITEKMLEDKAKLYDLLQLNNITTAVFSAIPETETNELFEMINLCVRETSEYLHSIAGMISTSIKDSDSVNNNLKEIIDTMQDPEQVGFLKTLLEKMG